MDVEHREDANGTSQSALRVSESSAQINDQSTWITSYSAPITFDVTVPANTPADDHVSIQFNPLFG
jgi:hypothetical protein